MECNRDDREKPLDVLLDDQIREFESGEDKECDKDLDRMIWELGDYENEEPLPEAEEFSEEQTNEEELVEKRMVRGINGKPSFKEGKWAEGEISPGEEVVMAHSITPVTRRNEGKATSRNPARKRKS